MDLSRLGGFRLQGANEDVPLAIPSEEIREAQTAWAAAWDACILHRGRVKRLQAWKMGDFII